MTYDILCVISLAKPRCSGGQTRWTCELSGLCKVYNPKKWPAEGAVLFRPIMWLYSASVVLVWDSFLPFTLLWPYSSKVHLVLATVLFFVCGPHRHPHFLCVCVPHLYLRSARKIFPGCVFSRVTMRYLVPLRLER